MHFLLNISTNNKRKKDLPEPAPAEPTTIAPMDPTEAPGPASTPTMSPTKDCDIMLEVICVIIDDSDVTISPNCQIFLLEPAKCEEAPTWIKLKYLATECSQSFNMQNETFFCTDFAPLPGANDVFIRVTTPDYSNDIFFEGVVPLDGFFNAHLIQMETVFLTI